MDNHFAETFQFTVFPFLCSKIHNVPVMILTVDRHMADRSGEPLTDSGNRVIGNHKEVLIVLANAHTALTEADILMLHLYIAVDIGSVELIDKFFEMISSQPVHISGIGKRPIKRPIHEYDTHDIHDDERQAEYPYVKGNDTVLIFHDGIDIFDKNTKENDAYEADDGLQDLHSFFLFHVAKHIVILSVRQ